MESKGEVSAADGIGDLPEPIIAHILSYLPTKDAVATSVLSKGWRLRWTLSTTFDVEEPQDGEIQFSEFIKTVFNDLDVESIHKYRLRLTNAYPVWSHVAEKPLRNLKVLDMASQSKTRPVVLQGQVLSVKTLEALKLGGNIVLKLSDRVCLPKLADLELDSIVTYESEDSLRALVSACPVLQSLTIKRTSILDNLATCTISSLSLRRLHIYFSCDYRQTTWIEGTVFRKLEIDTPTLECLVLHDSISEHISIRQRLAYVNEVDLHLLPCPEYHVARHSYSDPSCFLSALRSSTAGVLEALQGVKSSLKLSHQTMEASFDHHHPIKFVPTLNFKLLTKLVVELDLNRQAYSVVELMGHCVNLQVLSFTYLHDAAGSGYTLFPDQLPRCLSSSLKQVIFRPRQKFNSALELFKLILNHGAVMERVDICFNPKYFRWDEREYVHKKILIMDKASPTCTFYSRMGESGSWDILDS